jgi:hypothetical protein
VVLDNFIDGVEFINLVEADIKEIIPPLGLAKKILRLVPKVKTNDKPIFIFNYFRSLLIFNLLIHLVQLHV